jgi:hypothetical protein
MHLWFETDPFCQSLLRSLADDSHRLVTIPDEEGTASSVFALDACDCKAVSVIAAHADHLLSVTIIAGSPCVGFSRAKKGGKGIDDPESSKMWIVPALHTHLQKAIPAIPVGFILENVVMRDQSFSGFVTWTMKVDPTLTKAELVSPCARSRLIWSNIRHEMSRCPRITAAQAVAPGWIPAFSLFKDRAQFFGTFLRPFDPGRPQEYPAQYPRMPLSAYDANGLVIKDDLLPSCIDYIKDRLHAIHVASGDPRDPKSLNFQLRRDLCSWIHREGGSKSIRPLSSAERLACLGFQTLAAPDHSSSFDEQVPFLKASGNTFSVPIFVGLLAPLSDFINGKSPSPVEHLSLDILDRESALASLGSLTLNRNR